ncbi:MAG: hypothetical protein Aurels2KO_17710 [Aureliella sp.]
MPQNGVLLERSRDVSEVVEIVPPEIVKAEVVDGGTSDGSLQAGLSAADEIFRAGNPRAAARQYARLSLRFGASGQLLSRRFVAQVAAGEFEQASVIASLTRLMGLKITADSLPGKSLLGLGIDPVMAEALSEAVAEMAVLQRIDPERLEVVAVWLRMAGDNKRSKMFFSEAAKIRAIQSRSPSSSTIRHEEDLDLSPPVVPSAGELRGERVAPTPVAAPPRPARPSEPDVGILLLESPR